MIPTRERRMTGAGLPLLLLILVHGAYSAMARANTFQPQPNVLSRSRQQASGIVIYLTPEAWTQDVPGRNVSRAAGVFHKLVRAINDQLADQNATGDQQPLLAGLGFSAAAWHRWGGHLGMPVGMTDFAGYAGPDGWPVMEATGGDLFIHSKSDRRDVLFTLATAFVQLLGGEAVVESIDTTMAWRNGLDGSNRDLTGYVDGVNNCPMGKTAEMGLISIEQDPRHVNGSFAIAQRWLHDLAAFARLNVTAQNDVFGRTKRTSKPLPYPPRSAHLVRVDQDAFGYFIVRQAIPWGDSPGRAGLFFIAYSSDARRLEAMCISMVGQGTPVTPAGIPDAVMRFSVPETSNFWYLPSMQLLASLGNDDDDGPAAIITHERLVRAAQLLSPATSLSSARHRRARDASAWPGARSVSLPALGQ